ncbi:MAG: tetratricopeptide repeat protein, partial [Gemmatimonadota bacterium]|nr:tetratricopeptide repeat protein [Gemmatimonadota bacterium]
KQEYGVLARAAPNDATPILYLGRIAHQQNDSDEAIRQFERCVAVDEKNAECHAWLGNALGLTARRTSKFKLPFLAKRTKKEFDRAVELDPGNIDGRSGELEYYLNAPGFLGGSVDKAREQAAEIETRNKLRGAIAHGIIADHEKDAKASEVAYERAVAVAPDSIAGYNGLLNLYMRNRRWAEAFTTLDHIAARVPTELNVPIRLARLAYLSGEQLQRGEEGARRWIANPPAQASASSKATAHLRLGQLYEKTSRKELARTEYEQALSLNPKQEEARKSLDALK